MPTKQNKTKQKKTGNPPNRTPLIEPEKSKNLQIDLQMAYL